MSSNFSRDFIKAYFGSRFFSGGLPKLVEKKKFVLNPNAKEFVPEKDKKYCVKYGECVYNYKSESGLCADCDPLEEED